MKANAIQNAKPLRTTMKSITFNRRTKRKKSIVWRSQSVCDSFCDELGGEDGCEDAFNDLAANDFGSTVLLHADDHLFAMIVAMTHQLKSQNS